MRRIVLDTNCLLQALPTSSPYHKIWADVLTGKICLCVNTEILDEYEEILAKKTTKEIAHNVVEAIARLGTTIYQEVYIHFNLIKNDVDDNKFVDCAIAADAEYIVTNDIHFNVLKEIPWPQVTIIKIKDFVSQLQ
ncbi:MAG: putative toxin-antitoxin system toxin component, PIN family [Bacteroidaceae bacterium]|nr:putative toxin-antitoxin system toxin component, PIN family [Bacteroidaceae bacterium]